jgi:hypothetical protein
MVQILCTMYENGKMRPGKMRPVETIPGMGDKGEW